MKIDRTKSGEWIQPARRGFELGCCDCGLVHRFNFRLVGRHIQIQGFRDNQATAALRSALGKAK